MTTITAILTDNFADSECGTYAAAARGYCGIDIVTASPDGGALKSMGGRRVIPDMAINEMEFETRRERGTACDLAA